MGAIIFTGGIADGDQHSESSTARDFVLAQGIPEQAIFIEEVSTITQENIYYSIPFVEGASFDSVLIVSDPLHMKRAMLIAKDLGLDAHSSPTRTSGYQSLRTQLPFLAREVFFYIGYQIFG